MTTGWRTPLSSSLDVWAECKLGLGELYDWWWCSWIETGWTASDKGDASPAEALIPATIHGDGASSLLLNPNSVPYTEWTNFHNS